MTIPLRNRQPSATMRRRDLDNQEKMKVGRHVLKKMASSSAASVGNLAGLVTICVHLKIV